MIKLIVIVIIVLLIAALIGFMGYILFSPNPAAAQSNDDMGSGVYPVASQYLKRLEDFTQKLDDILGSGQAGSSDPNTDGFLEKANELKKLTANLHGCISEAPASASKIKSLEYLLDVGTTILTNYGIYSRYMTDSSQGTEFVKTLDDGLDNVIRIIQHYIDGILDDKIFDVNTEIQTLTSWYQLHGKELSENHSL